MRGTGEQQLFSGSRNIGNQNLNLRNRGRNGLVSGEQINHPLDFRDRKQSDLFRENKEKKV